MEERKLRTGTLQTSRDGTLVKLFYPVPATPSCTSCHSLVRTGELLAVIEVRHDSDPAVSQARSRILLILALLFPLPIVGGLLLSGFLSRRIGKAVTAIRESTRKVAVEGDFRAAELCQVDVGFYEFDLLFTQMRALATAVQCATRDQALQVHLLEKLMISAESVRDWQEEVARIGGAMHQVIPHQALIATLVQPDGAREVLVAWTGEPAPELKLSLVADVMELLGMAPRPDSTDLGSIHHRIARVDRKIAGRDPETIRNATCWLALEAPGVGGITGVAIVTDADKAPAAIGNILSPLVNVVGALRAIDRYARQIEYTATRDSLTDMYNQKMFWELLGYEVERAKRHGHKFCLVVLDLDGFKQVNDTYGHSFGDQFLREVAGTLRTCSRLEDMVARYGGDEFVFIASNAGREQGEAMGKRLLNCLSRVRLNAPDGSVLSATASVGLSVFPDHAATARELFLAADEAMYRAKKAGKARLAVADSLTLTT